MLDRHTSVELSELQAYEAAFGSLDPVADRRACMVAAQVWNAAGGIPDGDGPQAGRRAARPEDFAAFIAGAPRALSSGAGAGPVTHDGRDPVSHDDVEPDEGDVAARTETLKNMFALWGQQINARLQAQADQVDAGQPPANPDAN